MGEVVSGQSASFYMTKEPARSRGAPQAAHHFQNKTENPLTDRPIIKPDR
jgi:hypothetical protein